MGSAEVHKWLAPWASFALIPPPPAPGTHNMGPSIEETTNFSPRVGHLDATQVVWDVQTGHRRRQPAPEPKAGQRDRFSF